MDSENEKSVHHVPVNYVTIKSLETLVKHHFKNAMLYHSLDGEFLK